MKYKFSLVMARGHLLDLACDTRHKETWLSASTQSQKKSGDKELASSFYRCLVKCASKHHSFLVNCVPLSHNSFCPIFHWCSSYWLGKVETRSKLNCIQIRFTGLQHSSAAESHFRFVCADLDWWLQLWAMIETCWWLMRLFVSKGQKIVDR